jgi:ribulose 1,5-bisphosphate carboxylase large subunit-like protein
MFPVDHHGFQHLIGVLAGDLFYFEMPQYKLNNFIVNHLNLGSLARDAERHYRENKSYSIQEIREKFKLNSEEPLLAFSLKPRLGLSSKAIEKLALDITKEKFHIVELDTRNLPTDTQFFQELVEVAKTVTFKNERCGRVAHLSLNLSFSTPKAIEMAIQLTDALSDFCMLKIDGGLDGISTCQNLRKVFAERNKIQPIITCYPLLRNRLSTAIGEDTFVEMLVLSGVDIIYPGGAPRLTGQGGGYRNIDKDRLSTATEKYRKLIRKGFPMPTVAGGIHAGQLHAYYELLGPDVAYFIGGGVSLHKNGPTQGARLCRKSLDKAIQLRKKTLLNEHVQDFTGQLAQTMDKYERPEWMPADVFEYVPPSFIFKFETGIEPFCFT